MTKITRESIMEMTGADDWQMVVMAFSGMSLEDIEAECNDMWPHNDSVALAEAIHAELNA